MTKRAIHDGRITTNAMKTPRCRWKRDDAGDTLVEVLLALVVLALASVALIIAFGTSISASADHRDLANDNTVLASAEADVRSQTPASVFSSCPGSGYPTTQQLSAGLPSTDTASIDTVQYWTGSGWSITCAVDVPQLIKIMIIDKGSKQPVQYIEIVVDDPTTIAPTQGSNSTTLHLVFVTQPSGATYNAAFTSQPVVEVEDQNGNLVNSNLSHISISIATGPSGAVLSTCNGTESSGYVFYSGCSLNETGIYQLEVQDSQTGVAPVVSDAFSVTATQLNTPVIGNVISSTSTAGAVNVTFTEPPPVPSGQSYTVKACTDSAMSLGCVQQTGFTSGNDLDNLYPGTSYYVQVTATASTNYLPATSPPTGPVPATIQLSAPGKPTLAYGSSPGSINVSFAPSSNAATGQTYTVLACTASNMLSGCITASNFTSGSDMTGLPFTVGSQGALYYVEVSADASPGYLASTESAQASQIETSQIGAPGKPTVTSSTTTQGVVNATFSASTGVTPGGYTAEACTTASPLSGCTNPITAAPGGTQFTGLAAGTTYYIAITALSPNAGYVSNTSTPSNAVVATLQLAVPSTPTLTYGNAAGSINVVATSSNAPAGQTYTVVTCTNAAMSTGCVTNASFTSGSNITGLAYAAGTAGATYYVEVSANASTGYLASGLSTQASHGDTSILAVPGAPSATSSTSTAGALTVTFVGSTGQAPNSYTVTACTNTAMTTGCVATANVTSGGQATGLVGGTKYYLNVIAVSTNPAFLSSTSTTSGTSVMATVQLAVSTNVTVVPSSTTAGALGVTFSGPSNAPAGQTYSVTICSNAAMTTNCVTQSSYTSGTQITGFTGGTSYYATVTATASAGYLASTSAVSAAGVATVQLAAPTGVAVTSSTTTAGALNVSFAASTNAAAGQTYAITTCTNAGMTTGCATKTGVAAGANTVTGLTAGTNYYVTVAASSSTGYLASTASTPVVGPTLATVQLTAPTGVTVTSSTSTAGAINVSFTAPTNAGGGQSYTATACTNTAMTTGCVSVTSFTSGGQISGLTAGTTYYVTIAAPASAGYLASVSAVTATSIQATVQLTAPGVPTLGYGTAAGSLTATFAGSSNAPAGQIYTATACTNSGMTVGCVTNANFTSGSSITSLAYAAGTAGMTYYVEISANASAGYLASGLSTQASHADTSQLSVPGAPSATSSTTTAGALNVMFVASTGQAPNSYTVTACTNAGMTTACVGPTTIASGGGQLAGLTGGTSYYLSVNAVSTNAAFASATSATSGSSYLATVQLTAPTNVTVTSSTTTAGAINVSFTAPTNAGGGQSYTATACTNTGMTTGCVSVTGFTSGGQISGLTAATKYYVTIAAPASAGYLASVSAVTATSVQATVQLTAPTAVSAASSTTTANALSMSFTGSSNAPAGQTYAVTGCTNSGMTTGCVTITGVTAGASTVTGFTGGTNYYVTVSASASSGYLASTASTPVVGPYLATSQLNAITFTSITPSTTTTGVISVVFVAPSNAPGGETYSVTSCTNAGMTTGCVGPTAIASGGGNVSGLTAGGMYYIQIKAPASAGYLAVSSSASGPTMATVLLTNPSISSVVPSTSTAGALTVTITGSSNAPTGQTYAVTTCTNSGMTTGCNTTTGYVAGANTVTGMTGGTSYYATATATASSGYLASAPSGAVGPTKATTQLNAPAIVSVAAHDRTPAVTFTGSSNAPAGQSYTVTACTNVGMTAGCVAQTGFTSGNSMPNLPGTNYYYTVMAVSSTGYLSSTSTPAYGPVQA